MAFEFSVQLYSVRDVLRNDPLSVLQKLKAMGYSGVEGFGSFAYSSDDINYGLYHAGLKMVGYHTSWSHVQSDKLEMTIRYFKAIGNKYVIIPSLPEECTSSIDAWKRTAEKFNEVSKTLTNEGMILGYHNHHSEFIEMEGQIPFTVFFDNTDPAIVMQMDTGNALHGKADYMALMRRYPGRARSVHLKPYSRDAGFAPVIGEDDIDWKEFLSYCHEEGGTEHYIVEYEDEKTHPQLAGVELCIK